MNYNSELKRICSVLQEAAFNGESMLRALGEPFNGNTCTPEQIHMSYIELSATYAAIDIELKALFEYDLQPDADSFLYEELNTFQAHNKTMQNMMSKLSAAYKLYRDQGDCSGMKSWQNEFRVCYPDVLCSTKIMSTATVGLLREYERLASMTTVYASPEMMGFGKISNNKAPYPFNHAEDRDDLYMEEIYGSPQMMNKGLKDDYIINPNAEVVFGEDETIIFCPRCDKAIPGSRVTCPYCGFVLKLFI